MFGMKLPKLLVRDLDPPVTTPGVAGINPPVYPLAFFDDLADISGTGNMQWDEANSILALNGSLRLKPLTVNYVPYIGANNQLSVEQYLNASRGGLGKLVDLTGLADGYIIYYDLASDSWKVESLPAAAPHNILSSTHSDAVTASVVAGDLLYGNSTPKWDRLAKGTDNYALQIDATTHLPTWKTLPAAASHNLLDGSTDQDTVAQAATRGMLITGNSTPKWAGLAVGSSGKILTSDGNDPSWQDAKTFVRPAPSSPLFPSDPTGTTSTTGVMMGLGSTWAYTPTKSTSLLVWFAARIVSTVWGASSGVGYEIRHGTGTAPANGAAATGTNDLYCNAYGLGLAVNGNLPIFPMTLITGLSIGTQYWFDIWLQVIGLGTASVVGISAFVLEV